MYQIDRDINDVEIIDAFYSVIDAVLKGYNQPIRDGFKKTSRAEQIGYDVTNLLIGGQFIHIGQNDAQHRLEI